MMATKELAESFLPNAGLDLTSVRREEFIGALIYWCTHLFLEGGDLGGVL